MKIQLAYSRKIPEVGEPLDIEEIHHYKTYIFEVGCQSVVLVNISKVEELEEGLYKVYSGDTIYIVQLI
jgi:hypothetical protein